MLGIDLKGLALSDTNRSVPSSGLLGVISNPHQLTRHPLSTLIDEFIAALETRYQIPVIRYQDWDEGPTTGVVPSRRPSGSLRAMDSERRMPSVRDIWRLALAIIGVVAIIQELRKPPDERTWHGKVADLVPYDFRMPTIGRLRSTYWNPEGPILSGKVFGVGWAPNFGVLTSMFGKWRAREDSNAQSSDQ